MPAHPKAVEAFVAHLADSGLKVATIDKHVAAITYRHRMDDRDGVPPTSSEGVKAVLRGIRRTLGTGPDRKAPVTDKHLRTMLKALPDTLTGLRDRAMLAIGFSAAMRRSELVALDVRHIERTPEGILVTIERSKTDQEAAGRQVPILRGSRLKPVYPPRRLAGRGRHHSRRAVSPGREGRSRPRQPPDRPQRRRNGEARGRAGEARSDAVSAATRFAPASSPRRWSTVPTR